MPPEGTFIFPVAFSVFALLASRISRRIDGFNIEAKVRQGADDIAPVVAIRRTAYAT
jgi:hypothetical protein